jgi:hypothetical protein
VLQKSLAFAGRPASDEDVERLMQLGRFDTMRAKKRDGQFGSDYGRILTPSDHGDPDSYKCRRGTVGGYVDYLTAEDITYCEDVMRRHGYREMLANALSRYGISALGA